MSFETKFRKLQEEYHAAKVELALKVSDFKAEHALDEDAALSAGNIIGLAIGLIIIAAVIPSAIETFYGTNTSTWLIDGSEDTKTTTLWWLLPFISVAVVLYMLYKRLD